MVITADDILKVAAYTRPFPLAAQYTPKEPGLLAAMDDETLMSAPPQMIAHIQRTVAQGGMQVISPRQVPFSTLMCRPIDPARQIGDHVVGSVANPNGVWPTLFDEDIDYLLPDEPLPMIGQMPALREKTRTAPITSAGHLLTDPILGCLIKGRAVIDVLSRPDVDGSSEEVAALLATAWGIEKNDLMELDAFSLGYEGPLLRHAIKADEVYPTTHAPIHQRMCVSVGSTEITRDLLPHDSAMDWRRMRVFCETVFLLGCSIEGIPLHKMIAHPPPGDPTAPLNRRGTLAFVPAPCTAWSFEARSFSITTVGSLTRKSKTGIPKEVLSALTRYTKAVRPMSYTLDQGASGITKQTHAVSVPHAQGETLSSMYIRMSKALTTTRGRGKTAAATVRSCMYAALDEAPIGLQLRIARYMSIAMAECRIHLGTNEVPDNMVAKIATRFLDIGSFLRLRVTAEAARRGASVEEWWADILSQAPDRYGLLTEGTSGWAKIGMWLAFKSPTDKWQALIKANHYSALRKAGKASVGGMRLPAEKGSSERLLAAARHVAEVLTASYSSYYMGVSDVAMSLADEFDNMSKPRSADIMREASHLWTLRARAFRGTNINLLAHDQEQSSENHLRVKARPVDLVIVPAPYRAFHAYTHHAMASPVVSNQTKAVLREYGESKLSYVFSKMKHPICPAKESTTTRYLTTPSRLGDDMEKAWKEMRGDIAEIAGIYGAQVEKAPVEPTDAISLTNVADAPLNISITFKKRVPGEAVGYFDTIGYMDFDNVAEIEELLEELPEHIAEGIYNGMYRSAGELMRAVMGEHEAYVEASGAGAETVR